MKLTKNQLRKMIKEELLKEEDVYSTLLTMDKGFKIITKGLIQINKRISKTEFGKELIIIGKASNEISKAKFDILGAVQSAVKKDKSLRK